MRSETGLYPVTSKCLRDELEKLRRNQITPWAFLGSGRPMRVVDFYGKEISYEGGRFDGSPRAVFWGRYIEPFLEDIALRMLDQSLRLCKEEGHEPREALRETGRLLKEFIRDAYGSMVDVDQRLRGSGYPEKAARRSVSDEIATMQDFVDKRLAGLVAVAQPTRTRLTTWQDYWANHRVGAALLLTAALVIGLATVTDSASKLVAVVTRLVGPSPETTLVSLSPGQSIILRDLNIAVRLDADRNYDSSRHAVQLWFFVPKDSALVLSDENRLDGALVSVIGHWLADGETLSLGELGRVRISLKKLHSGTRPDLLMRVDLTLARLSGAGTR